MISAQIRRCRRLIPAAADLVLVAHDYESVAKPSCDWSDPDARSELVDGLVTDRLAPPRVRGPRVRRLVQPPTSKTSKAQCLALPTTAIATWTPPTSVQLSTTVYQHINLHRRYDVTNTTTPPPGQLRPLTAAQTDAFCTDAGSTPSWPICRIHRWSLPTFARRAKLDDTRRHLRDVVSLGRLTPQLWQSPTLTEAKSALWRQRSVASAPSAHPQPGQSVSVGTNYARVRLRRFA